MEIIICFRKNTCGEKVAVWGKERWGAREREKGSEKEVHRKGKILSLKWHTIHPSLSEHGKGPLLPGIFPDN